MSDVISIYVADLADYNAGELRGEWIELEDKDLNEVQEEIQKMLSLKPGHEEWAIHDSQGFYDYRTGENPDLSEIVEIAKYITKYGKVFAELINHFGDAEEAIQTMQDKYCGMFEKIGDYGYSFAHSVYGETELGPLEPYIDYEYYENDMELNGNIIVIEEGFRRHIFSL